MATQQIRQTNGTTGLGNDSMFPSGRALTSPGQARLPADAGTREIVNALGLFSFALGLAQITMPGELARLIGVRPTITNLMIMRFCGFREIASGVGLFLDQRPAAAAKARLAGDIMDLVLVGRAFSSRHSRKERVLFAIFSVLGVTALDAMASRQLDQETGQD